MRDGASAMKAWLLRAGLVATLLLCAGDVARAQDPPDTGDPPATEQVEPVGSEPDATDEDTDTGDPPATEQVEPVSSEPDASDEDTDTDDPPATEQVEPVSSEPDATDEDTDTDDLPATEQVDTNPTRRTRTPTQMTSRSSP